MKKFNENIKLSEFRKLFFWMTVGLSAMMWTVILSSCAIPKNMDLQKQVDYTSDFNKISSLIAGLQTDINKQTKNLNEKISNMKIENRTVYLSNPDSTGKQYPLKVSETNASRKDEEYSKIEDIISVNIQSLSVRIDSIAKRMNYLINEHDKVVELSWWDLHKDKVYAGVILLLFVFVFVSKFKKGG